MPEIPTKIIIIKPDWQTDPYPEGTVDTDSTAGTIVQDIKNLLKLPDDYELYIKVSPETTLNSFKAEIEKVVIMAVNLKSKPSVSLGPKK